MYSKIKEIKCEGLQNLGVSWVLEPLSRKYPHCAQGLQLLFDFFPLIFTM